jgi:hypothetical protein
MLGRADAAERARRVADDADRLAEERALAVGREPTSMAFFNTPGIERLYSGVTNSTPSTSAAFRGTPASRPGDWLPDPG